MLQLKPNTPPLDVALFDWPGVLTQHHQAVASALRVAGQRLGIAADWGEVARAWDLRHMLQLTQRRGAAQRQERALDESLRSTLADLGLAESRYPAAVRAEVVCAWRGVPLWPDVAPALRRLQGRLTLAVCSTAERRTLEDAATAYALPFTRIFGADMLRGSPLVPAYFVEIARRLRHSVDRLLFVSDNGPQLLAAAAAGCRTALVTREGSEPLLPQAALRPDLTARALDALAGQLLDRQPPQRVPALAGGV